MLATDPVGKDYREGVSWAEGMVGRARIAGTACAAGIRSLVGRGNQAIWLCFSLVPLDTFVPSPRLSVFAWILFELDVCLRLHLVAPTLVRMLGSAPGQ